MRIIIVLALGAFLTGCSEPPKEQATGPAPLPAHPVADVSKPMTLPPVAGSSQSAAASDCGPQDGCKRSR